MANPFLVVVLALLTIAGLGGVVLFLLRPAKEEIPPADALNDSRISGQWAGGLVGSSRVDLQACKLEYSIVSPK